MNLPASVHEQVKTLIAQNKKINAVKLVHTTLKCGLKEAKDIVDQISAGQWIPTSNTTTTTTPVGDIDTRLRALMARGQKLEAIKLYRDYSHADLATSKDYVERLMQYGPNGARTTTGARQTTSTQIDSAMQQQAGPVRNYDNTKAIIVTVVMIVLIMAYAAWKMMHQQTSLPH